jgi:hypothetical protein
MPLEKGPVGSAAFGRNIAIEEKAGKPQKQAEAIAYSEAGEKKDCAMTDRLDSILAKCDSMERRVDALCAGRQDMISSNYPKVKHIAAVQSALRDYKAVYPQGGAPLKEAENKLNAEIEKACSPH